MRSAEEIWDEACKGACKGDYSSYPEVGRAAIEQAQREAIEAAAMIANGDGNRPAGKRISVAIRRLTPSAPTLSLDE